MELHAQRYAITHKNNQFAFDFYKECSKEKSGNVFISPFSISSALAMTYPGARGKTADEMKQAVGFLADVEKQNEEYADLTKSLTGSGSPFTIANTLWAQTGLRYENKFRDINATYFGANFKDVNFADSENTRKEINATIEKQTHDKIKDLLPPGSIDGNTKLILANAVYFKDVWARPFKKEHTTDGKFFPEPQNAVAAKMMQQTGSFKGFENEVVSILELPYKHPNFSMIILLPKIGMEKFETDFLNSENYATWELSPVPFNKILIPRFKLEQTTEPISILQQFGMVTAFVYKEADFSGITTELDLYISNIYHKAFVEVNEEGTEAAAATAVVMSIRGVQPKPRDFIADHPFIFIIQDVRSKSILFIGKLVNP